VNSPDWEQYDQTFPTRYLKKGALDTWLEEWVHNHGPVPTILDIGGGIEGTEALRNLSEVWALDTGVAKAPKDQIKTTWEEVPQRHFDLVVLRGSINYLSLDELEKLPHLPRSGGLVVFNTFLEPRDMTRPFENKAGQRGQESSKFDPRTGLIEHTLETPDQTLIHHFHHRPPELFHRIFDPHGNLGLQTNKTNSVLGTFLRKP
jgi:hypothetical protein